MKGSNFARATTPRACVLVQKPHTSVFSGVYDDHLGPSNSENDNETIKNRGDYVETTIKGPDYLTSRIYRQRFTISAEQKRKKKCENCSFLAKLFSS